MSTNYLDQITPTSTAAEVAALLAEARAARAAAEDDRVAAITSGEHGKLAENGDKIAALDRAIADLVIAEGAAQAREAEVAEAARLQVIEGYGLSVEFYASTVHHVAEEIDALIDALAAKTAKLEEYWEGFLAHHRARPPELKTFPAPDLSWLPRHGHELRRVTRKAIASRSPEMMNLVSGNAWAILPQNKSLVAELQSLTSPVKAFYRSLTPPAAVETTSAAAEAEVAEPPVLPIEPAPAPEAQEADPGVPLPRRAPEPPRALIEFDPLAV
ncbi:hypothetical protein [Geminicoccus flavidas]|uniref:hypothetical protein n=1 Tax=Geminicoccus flavidas TaxID=2506407 RepID=UPI00135A8B66|nr:hypothetical protein [Geminicoccus flavidas]